jgi:hypothetical protein
MKSDQPIASSQKSLTIIDNMVIEAQQNFAQKHSDIPLISGWSFFLRYLLLYLSNVIFNLYSYNSLLGGILIISSYLVLPLGAIVILIITIKTGGTLSAPETYLKRMTNYFLAGFIFSGLILSFIIYWISHNTEAITLVFLVLVGTMSFFSGGLLKFKPQIVCGICMWIFAIITTMIGQINLFIALTFLFGGIIPIHILRAQYHAQRKAPKTT